eukprot:662843-Pyramimonas_sp.AAC.1
MIWRPVQRAAPNRQLRADAVSLVLGAAGKKADTPEYIRRSRLGLHRWGVTSMAVCRRASTSLITRRSEEVNR